MHSTFNTFDSTQDLLNHVLAMMINPIIGGIRLGVGLLFIGLVAPLEWLFVSNSQAMQVVADGCHMVVEALYDLVSPLVLLYGFPLRVLFTAMEMHEAQGLTPERIDEINAINAEVVSEHLTSQEPAACKHDPDAQSQVSAVWRIDASGEAYIDGLGGLSLFSPEKEEATLDKKDVAKEMEHSSSGA